MLDPKGKGHLGLTSGRIGGYLWPTRETAEPPATTVQPPASSSIQSYARTQQEFNYSCICRTGHRSAVKQLCDTMTKQIRSRAFYGWLSHCRHLKTVRTHLSGLVNATIMLVDEPRDASKGLTMELWNEMNQNGVVTESQELYRLVYYGGCVHEARIQVWPYLLGHYKFGTTAAERHDTNKTQRCQYEQTMSEWMAVEAIVRQRDKEATAANLVKVSQGSQDGHIPLVRKDSNLSNDVFMSVESDDYVPPETLPEESSNATSSPDGDAANSVIDVVTRGSFVQEGELNGTGDGKHTKSVSDEGLGDSIAQAPKLCVGL
ncbi:Small G protein signaling modulator 2 [Lamellibrachia satsuma]|nr:Small G protein signaling modulator 2 [Lamellibrachia satsuma]